MRPATSTEKRLAALAAADWHPADVKAALEKRGLSIRELARQLGVPNENLSRALRVPSPTSERRLATALGIAPEVIWPSRYALRAAQAMGITRRRSPARPSTAEAPRSKRSVRA
jgi:Ner family transcriptional regulator